MQEQKIDYTEYGEDWVNLMLDLRLALKNATTNYPHFVFYTWNISKNEQDGIAAGAEWTGDDIYGLVEPFFLTFNKDRRLIPVIATSMNRFIESCPEEDRDKYRGALARILKINDKGA